MNLLTLIGIVAIVYVGVLILRSYQSIERELGIIRAQRAGGTPPDPSQPPNASGALLWMAEGLQRVANGVGS